MIAVASHALDDHFVAVHSELTRAGHPVELVDTAAYPGRASLTLEFGNADRRLFSSDRPGAELPGTNRRDDQKVCVDLQKVGAVWWRRPQPYTLASDIEPSAAAFAYSESHEAMAGMWETIDAAWVNPPLRDEAAHHKPLQLARACEIGLPVPSTLITNEPAAAREFIARTGPDRTVFKTFIATETHWRETRLVGEKEIELLDQVRLAPVIFQQFVPAVADLRVTVLGERMIAAEITQGPDAYRFDYRMDLAGATIRPTTLPDGVKNQLGRLMRRLGLTYGAVDLRLTPEGEYVFLEVNPAGEWLFIEERTGQPISAAMAQLLMSLDGSARR